MGNRDRRLKLAVLSNELFSRDIGRMGGFGWAVRQVSRCFSDNPELGVDVVIIMGEKPHDASVLPNHLHGCRVLWPYGSKWSQAQRIWREKIDLLLSIDYRPNYTSFFHILPRVPIVIWVRDPWDAQDRAEVATLRIPGQDSEKPHGTGGINTRSLSKNKLLSQLLRRPVLFATTTPFLIKKVPDAYGFDPGQVHSLPNIIRENAGAIKKSCKPIIISLARLDPVKRPWLFAKLAGRFPEAEFIFMGQSHFNGPGSWEAGDLPGNVRLIGHVDEPEKERLLSAAWLLVSTSIHEGLSISFLESLACETPLVGFVNPEGIVSRFGVCVGPCPGTGLDAMPTLESSTRNLLSDSQRRASLGKDGRKWVSETHNRQRFLAAFSDLCSFAGIDPAKHNLSWHHQRLNGQIGVNEQRPNS